MSVSRCESSDIRFNRRTERNETRAGGGEATTTTTAMMITGMGEGGEWVTQKVAYSCALSSPEDDEGQISKSDEDCSFDEIIGHIEDLLLEKEFQDLQQRFLEKYWDVFEPVEDNKLIYTDIFNEYVKEGKVEDLSCGISITPLKICDAEQHSPR
ncbi:hypothetical protein DMN91_009004 [Ooceraea biroi]|uniref:ADP-ribosylation factor-like protein 2-binding protein n=1 Tax=Ooceraea biroi TaxID=2015173 RepID=A0A3L8DDV6_OOCBI|nr:hypothetical protein DMN91_009004 [Ooceraea biroi]